MTEVQCLAAAPTPGNSLGMAKSPCHNCFESKLECDRQRPRCFLCMQIQVECRGYKLDLSWQSDVAVRGNLKGFQYPISQPPIKHGVRTSGSPSPDASQRRGKRRPNGQFKFVTGRPIKRRKVQEQAGQTRFDSRGLDRSPEGSPASITSPTARELVPSTDISTYHGKHKHQSILCL
jgi:hypothetical protein